jgi:RsiW-degrading membrane proteinase PrsW (M82 family)
LNLSLLALAVAPGVAICLFIYAKDKYNKEPTRLLIGSFIRGVLCTLPAIAIQMLLHVNLDEVKQLPWWKVAVFAFGVVAISEELCKYVAVKWYAWRKPEFDEPFDGIVYAVMVSMGFATLENIGYVYEHGVATGIMRMFLAVPAHATFGVLMGYYMGLAKFSLGAQQTKYLLLSRFWPIVFHGSYDFFLFVGDTLLHFAGAVFSFYIAVRLSRLAIKKHQALSAAAHQRNSELEPPLS